MLGKGGGVRGGGGGMDGQVRKDGADWCRESLFTFHFCFCLKKRDNGEIVCTPPA